MPNSNKKALTAGTWYVISNFLNKGIVLLSTPLVTRMLSTEDFGITGTYNSLYSIMLVLATLNVSSSIAVARFDFLSEKEYDRYISSTLVLSIISSTIIFFY